jgi:hypothetical protein
MSLTLNVKLTIKENDPIVNDIMRLTRSSERTSLGVRRLINRYKLILDNCPPCPDKIIRDLANTISTIGFDLLGRIGYPPKDELLRVIENAPVEKETRISLIKYIENCTYVSYAKMIEGVENMYR